MSSLKGYLDGLSFKKFMPEGKIHLFLDHHLGKAGGALSDAGILSHRMGLYPGDYLAEWLTPILQDDLGVRTFADLKITLEEDPGMSLPESRRYRLVVHTSDITRGELARLPWDYNYYGHDRDAAGGGARRAGLHVDPLLLRAGDLRNPGRRRGCPPTRWRFHHHALRARHRHLGRRRHVAELPDRRLRADGRRTTPLAHHRDQAVVTADVVRRHQGRPPPPSTWPAAASAP